MMQIKFIALAAAASSAIIMAAAPANAASIITAIGADLSQSDYNFTYKGTSFTFGFNGDYFGGGPLTISTNNGGEFNTIFGQPTTNFADGRGGPVTFGPTMQYAAFDSATPIRFTNGDNFFGLRAVTSRGTFYGYGFSSNNVLNSIGFESVADETITARPAIGAVPEPATWAMMIGGFGMIGATMRRRKTRASVSYT
nr:PEPxxWA-CTERM sorting domain-containing protein [Sphingomonas profundi]